MGGEFFGELLGVHRELMRLPAEFVGGQMVSLTVGSGGGLVGVGGKIVKFRGSIVRTLRHGVLLNVLG
jgi:hypothetical protein